MAENSQPTGFEAVRTMNVSLSEKLRAYADSLAVTKPEVGRLYDDLIGRLSTAEAGAGAPMPGSQMIPFIMPDSEGQLVSSKTLLQKGPLVISFNRGHWCSFCRLELLALSEINEEIKKAGGTIVSITPDRAQSIQAFREEFKIPFAMLTDLDSGYALANGLMFSIGEAFVQKLLDRGLDLASVQGSGGYFVPLPATLIVRQDGIIADLFVDPDFRKRMQPEDVLAAVKAL